MNQSADIAPAAAPRVPLYQQMKDDLLRRVQEGEWRPGELLPSEIALAQEYKISVGTARKAIEELAGDRLLIRQRGRGTTVATLRHRREPFPFYRLMNKDGACINEETRYLSCGSARADAEESKALAIRKGAGVIRVQRLRFLKWRPLVLLNSSLPAELFPGLENLLKSNVPESIHSIIERHFHVIIGRVEEKISPHIADKSISEKLKDVSVGSPILHIKRISYDLKGNPIEFRLTVASGEAHYFNVIS